MKTIKKRLHFNMIVRNKNCVERSRNGYQIYLLSRFPGETKIPEPIIVPIMRVIPLNNPTLSGYNHSPASFRQSKLIKIITFLSNRSSPLLASAGTASTEGSTSLFSDNLLCSCATIESW